MRVVARRLAAAGRQARGPLAVTGSPVWRTVTPMAGALRWPSILSSREERDCGSTRRSFATDTSTVEASPYAFTSRGEECIPSPVFGRFAITAEVVVSKIFPAGFGWQGSSAVAESMGLEATDLGFFITTGGGDFVGVLTGHCLFYAIKKATFDPSINMAATFQVGWWLASAAFMSGAAWQPLVNAFQAEGVAFSFNTACMMTTIGCGLMFYTGLRLGRSIYRPILPVVPGPDYLNLRMDAQLSMAVGGATGCFVGTDVSYGSSNWLGVFGIGVEETDSVLEGMIKAGTLTAMGFTAVQTAQNVFVPHNHCWLD